MDIAEYILRVLRIVKSRSKPSVRVRIDWWMRAVDGLRELEAAECGIKEEVGDASR
jgi:hypothetical protein